MNGNGRGGSGNGSTINACFSAAAATIGTTSVAPSSDICRKMSGIPMLFSAIGFTGTRRGVSKVKAARRSLIGVPRVVVAPPPSQHTSAGRRMARTIPSATTMTIGLRGSSDGGGSSAIVVALIAVVVVARMVWRHKEGCNWCLRRQHWPASLTNTISAIFVGVAS